MTGNLQFLEDESDATRLQQFDLFYQSVHLCQVGK